MDKKSGVMGKSGRSRCIGCGKFISPDKDFCSKECEEDSLGGDE